MHTVSTSGLAANFPGALAKRSACLSRPGKLWRRSGMAGAAGPLHNCSPEGDAPQIQAGQFRFREGNSMNPNKALWEKGDFTEIAALMRQSGEAVVSSLEITTPLRVLDLGCGDGTTAVPL